MKKRNRSTRLGSWEWKKMKENENLEYLWVFNFYLKKLIWKFQKVLPKLSTRTQQKLIRIVMTQQNQTLSVGEKERILRHISTSMDNNTKNELARFLSDKDLFSLIYWFIVSLNQLLKTFCTFLLNLPIYFIIFCLNLNKQALINWLVKLCTRNFYPATVFNKKVFFNLETQFISE